MTKSMKGGPQLPARSQNSQVWVLSGRASSRISTTHCPSVTSTGLSRFPAKGRNIAVQRAQRNIQIKIARFDFRRSRRAMMMSKARSKAAESKQVQVQSLARQRRKPPRLGDQPPSTVANETKGNRHPQGPMQLGLQSLPVPGMRTEKTMEKKLFGIHKNNP